MGVEKIYILHKNGADSHYTALQFLLEKNGHQLQFREFSVFSKFFKSLKKGDFKSFRKQFTNLGFILTLMFSKNKKVVLGIAPFDSKLPSLLRILKNHQVYYHTSWTCWDKTFHPKTKNNTPKMFQKWKTFLENQVKYIFCVTEKSKEELLKNYNIQPNKINVVYHSLNPVFTEEQLTAKKEKSFLYVGRLVPQKGVDELLYFFSHRNDCSLTIIGDGKEKSIVEKFANRNKHIEYKLHISDKKELVREMSKHQYLVLNSKKTNKWEELFGLVIIECMAQGVIPVTTDHSGPKEILSKDTGILYKEGQLSETLDKLLENHTFDENIHQNCKEISRNYLPEVIAERWRPILQ